MNEEDNYLEGENHQDSRDPPFHLTEEEIEQLCTLGGYAPSPANLQPWDVRIDGKRIHLFLHRARSKSLLDVNHLASIFSLGSFAENVAIAASSFGLVFELVISDSCSFDDPIATFTFTERTSSQKEDPLYPYLKERVTNRKAYDGTIVEDADLESLTSCLSGIDGLSLSFKSSSEDKRDIAKTLGKADIIRIKNKPLFTDMMNEVVWPKISLPKLYIDVNTLELPKSMTRFLLGLKKIPPLRHLIPSPLFASSTHVLVKKCSHVGCLAIADEDIHRTKQIFRAGQCLERVWLYATKLGLSFQPWTILPFLLIRAKNFDDNSYLSKRDNRLVCKLGRKLQFQFSLPVAYSSLFIFRLFKSDLPTARSLRMHWKDYTTINQ